MNITWIMAIWVDIQYNVNNLLGTYKSLVWPWQCSAKHKEPIQTTEKWRWKNFSTRTSRGRIAATHTAFASGRIYHSKNASYGPASNICVILSSDLSWSTWTCWYLQYLGIILGVILSSDLSWIPQVESAPTLENSWGCYKDVSITTLEQTPFLNYTLRLSVLTWNMQPLFGILLQPITLTSWKTLRSLPWEFVPGNGIRVIRTYLN